MTAVQIFKYPRIDLRKPLSPDQRSLRQKTVKRFMYAGVDLKTIAKEMNISYQFASECVIKIYRDAGCNSREEFMAKAISRAESELRKYQQFGYDCNDWAPPDCNGNPNPDIVGFIGRKGKEFCTKKDLKLLELLYAGHRNSECSELLGFSNEKSFFNYKCYKLRDLGFDTCATEYIQSCRLRQLLGYIRQAKLIYGDLT